MIRKIISKYLFLSILAFPLGVFASPEQTQNPQEEESFTDVIMHHISDSHEYHLLDWQGTPVTLPLPIILWTENGLVTFLSSEFHHDDKGEVIVEKKGLYFVRVHGQIHYTDANGTLSYNNDHKLENPRPLDFSITKNVVLLFLIALIMFLAFTAVARSYKKNPKAPKGFANLLETLVVFVRDDIAVPNIGNHKYERYMPYLLTVFFLILIGNLLGLVPIISGTLTNDIVFTGTLAVITFLITTFSGNRNYWQHIFATPGVPKWLAPIMIPVEIIGMLTKPFSLMIRLFANITAGHVIILSLIGLIFTLKTIFVSPVSVGFSLFISILELLVAFIQAYVFTLLSALFIGGAVAEERH
ncbi:F0F1 ATP synthase subunit A [uncultured Capnocytophaga sp.]|uniref:F0F1 ATP synthase subunit A n=1 Tax=uncultured Capnocytophaga sp. TaxID=159273 RepID=UPI00262D5F34|nr:F0F1 ATP synthase subunit A [uncultured Capnocytophaga sp.]